MSNFRITDLTSYSNVDPVNDLIEIVDKTNNQNKSISRNNLLGLASAPVGLTDSQTLTNKVLTAPTLSSPILSGTITGTYTLAGTPTFPAAVVTLTGSQTLTNKILTSPTINAPTITNASITADAITGFSSANTGTIYGMAVTNSVIPNSALPSGTIVQIVNTQTAVLATGTTLVPYDNTIPQNTEGDQYMSLSITPKSATNTLFIQVLANLGLPAVLQNCAGAIFQDTTANALAVSSIGTTSAAAVSMMMPITYKMAAGTTSTTTFKFRAGVQISGTLTFNGITAGNFFGGTYGSSITITEYKN